MPVVGCVDVGGTVTKTGVLDDGHDLRHQGSAPTPAGRSRDGREVVEAVRQAVRELREHRDLDAVGVVVPGIVDEATGTAVWSANLGWRDLPLRSLLLESLDVPVAFGHDVRAGALAESRLGAARDVADSAFLALGTGIAAGLVVGGRPVGGRGWAGEIGHDDVGHGEPCACGLTGCLEAIASAGAIARRYAAATGDRVDGAKAVAELAASGDTTAVQVWQDAVEALGLELSHMARLVDPAVVVVGGGLSRAGDQLLDPLRLDLARRLGEAPPPRLVTAELGHRAGCVGAGLLALDLLEAGR